MQKEKERERKKEKLKKKDGAHAVTSAIVDEDETLNPFLESARSFLKFVCGSILAHSTWKSDLVNGLGCFDCFVNFYLLEDQAAMCFGSLYYNFNVHGCLKPSTCSCCEIYAFFYDVRYAYLDEDNIGPARIWRHSAMFSWLS